MRKLVVFNHISLDGYFSGMNGDISWTHKNDQDAEWNAFVAANATAGGQLLFGRITYDLMAGYWPTPAAAANSPAVADGMNQLPKVVFSRTMDKPTWNNTKLVKGNLPAEVRKLKEESGKDMVILGSGSIVSQLAQEGLVDEYQIVVNPIALGRGRTMFDGMQRKLALKRTKSQNFGNGNVLLSYEAVK